MVGVVAAGGAAMGVATSMLAVVLVAAQAVVVVPTPGVPVSVLALAASGTPLTFVPVTIKDVTSSSEVRATPLGPSALRLESCIGPNTPPKVMFATIPTGL